VTLSASFFRRPARIAEADIVRPSTAHITGERPCMHRASSQMSAVSQASAITSSSSIAFINLPIEYPL